MKFKKYKKFLLLAAGIVLLLGIFLGAFYIKDLSLGRNQNSVEAGRDPALFVKNFRLENLKGKQVSLSDYKGKIIVLNFWASWCPPCKAELPEFVDLLNEYKNQNDVTFLFINLTDGVKETKETVAKFIEDQNYPFEVLLDQTGEVSNTFGVDQIPLTIVIDKDSYISGYTLGQTTKEKIEQLIQDAG